MAHTLARLRFADAVTDAVARLATGLDGLTPGRAGFAPAGNHFQISYFVSSVILSDQHCLVASTVPRKYLTTPREPHRAEGKARRVEFGGFK